MEWGAKSRVTSALRPIQILILIFLLLFCENANFVFRSFNGLEGIVSESVGQGTGQIVVYANPTERYVEPGDVAIYNITVRNIGEDVRKLDLKVLTPPTKWFAYISRNVIEIDPKSNVTVELYVYSPREGTVQDSATITVSAKSGELVEGQVSTTTRIREIRKVDFWSLESIKRVRLGERVCNFVMHLENKGTITDEYKINWTAWTLNTPVVGWNVSVSEDVVKLEPNKIKDILVSVTVPGDAKEDDYSIFIFNVSSKVVPSVYDNDGFVKTVVEPSYFLEFAYDYERYGAYSKEVENGSIAEYRLNVTNRGKHNDSVFFVVYNDTRLGWSCEVSPNRVDIDINETIELNLSVRTPERAWAYDGYFAIVRGESEHNKSMYILDGVWNYIVTLTKIKHVRNASYEVEPGEYWIGNVNEKNEINVTIKVWNFGNYYDRYKISFYPLPDGWGMEPRVKDIEAWEIFLPRNGSFEFKVKLLVPKNAQGGMNEIKSRLYNEEIERLGKIVVYVDEIKRIDFSIEPEMVRGYKGESLKFYVMLRNIGNTYFITNLKFVVVNSSSSSEAWDAKFLQSGRVNLSVGKSLEIVLQIVVPRDAQRGMHILGVNESDVLNEYGTSGLERHFRVEVLAGRAAIKTTSGDDMCIVAVVMLIVIMISVFAFFKFKPPGDEVIED
ncbi:MAG: hypothetical protein QXT63_03755 [Thermoplasmata archaeon]